MRRLSPKCIKILKTVNLYCCFFVLGLTVAVPGPCLLDLKYIVQADIHRISLIYMTKSIGYLFGSILGGILLDALKCKQAIMTTCNFFMASSMLGIPWSRSPGALTGYMVVNGLAIGILNTGGNVMCLTLWGGDSGPFYQALHFTFGLGGLVAPLIAAPFLGDYSEEAFSSVNNLTHSDNFTNFTTQLVNRNNFALVDTIPNIIYPFSIIGGLGLLVTVMFLVACIKLPLEEKVTHRKRSQDTRTSFGFLCSVLILNFLLFFFENGTEIGYAQMITTYAVKSRLQLSSSTGSYMTSTFWAAFTISRLASVFLSIKVSNLTLIICDLVISFIGSLVLLFLASYEWAIWLASVILGIGLASFFAAAVAWLDTYVCVTNKIASVFTIGGATGEMAVPFTISYFIESVPDILLYIISTCCISFSLIVFILYLILRKRAKRDINTEPEYSVVRSVNT